MYSVTPYGAGTELLWLLCRNLDFTILPIFQTRSRSAAANAPSSAARTSCAKKGCGSQNSRCGVVFFWQKSDFAHLAFPDFNANVFKMLMVCKYWKLYFYLCFIAFYWFFFKHNKQARTYQRKPSDMSVMQPSMDYITEVHTRTNTHSVSLSVSLYLTKTLTNKQTHTKNSLSRCCVSTATPLTHFARNLLHNH